MSAADNLGNLFVALLAGIPLLIFVLFACCACLEASIQAARRSYKPHLPTRVRFADEAEDNNRRQRNPLLFGLNRSNRSGGDRIEGSGLVAHSSYIQRYPNYRYSTVGQPGRSTPPPVLKSRTELGSGSLKSPVSPLVETQRLLDHDYCHRTISTPTRSSLVGSPATPVFAQCSVPQPQPAPPPIIAGSGVPPSVPIVGGTPGTCLPPRKIQSPTAVAAASPSQPVPSAPIPSAPVPIPPTIIATTTIHSPKAISPPTSSSSALPPGRAVRQETSSSADTQPTQITQKTSPIQHITSVLNFFDGNQRSSTSPTTTPNFQIRPKSPFESCGPHVDPQQQRRYSTPSSPTMYAYAQNLEGPSNYSSMSYLPEVRTYLHFMEEDFSNRQRSHSFSGRCASRSPRKVHPYLLPRRSPSPFNLDRTMVEDNASKISTPSSFGTTFLTPPGSTDQGSFKSPESGTPEWLLSSDVPPTRFIIPTAFETDEGGVTYKQLSRSNSIRAATV